MHQCMDYFRLGFVFHPNALVHFHINVDSEYGIFVDLRDVRIDGRRSIATNPNWIVGEHLYWVCIRFDGHRLAVHRSLEAPIELGQLDYVLSDCILFSRAIQRFYGDVVNLIMRATISPV